MHPLSPYISLDSPMSSNRPCNCTEFATSDSQMETDLFHHSYASIIWSSSSSPLLKTEQTPTECLRDHLSPARSLPLAPFVHHTHLLNLFCSRDFSRHLGCRRDLGRVGPSQARTAFSGSVLSGFLTTTLPASGCAFPQTKVHSFLSLCRLSVYSVGVLFGRPPAHTSLKGCSACGKRTRRELCKLLLHEDLVCLAKGCLTNPLTFRVSSSIK